MNDIVKTPRQKRSRDTLEQLMSAGVDLLMQGEDAEFSVAALSMKSGVSIGSIYQRFGSKDMIYLALQERVLEAMDREVTRLFPPSRPDDLDDAGLIRDAVARFCGHVARNEKIILSLSRFDAGNPRAMERGARSCGKVGEAFSTYLETAFGVGRRDDYDNCFRMMFACTWTRITGAPLTFDPATVDWTSLSRFLGDLCVAFLLPTNK